jgi:hypothetical protein
MFTRINNISIAYSFDPGLKVLVDGPDRYYYVEVREYLKGSTDSRFIEGYHISSTDTDKCYPHKEFTFKAAFYGDFEILVYKMDFLQGLTKIFSHRFDDRDRVVKFEVDTENKEEAELWVKRILEYVRRHGCRPIIITKFEEINHRHKNFFSNPGIEIYKTYKIGRYPKTSNDFRTLDPRREGVIWFGFWKEFWSYEHPRLWKFLSSQEVVDDILGL